MLRASVEPDEAPQKRSVEHVLFRLVSEGRSAIKQPIRPESETTKRKAVASDSGAESETFLRQPHVIHGPNRLDTTHEGIEMHERHLSGVQLSGVINHPQDGDQNASVK